MEATVVSVGKSVLVGALGYARSKAAEEVTLQLGVEGDVAFIADELEMMQSFIMATDEEHGPSTRCSSHMTAAAATLPRGEASSMAASASSFGKERSPPRQGMPLKTKGDALLVITLSPH